MTVGIRSARANSVHLHFKNVALNQARQFSRSVELHGTRSKDFRLRTSVEPAEGGTPKVVAELNRGTWRWSEARLTSNLDELVGKKVSSLDLEISVPRLSALSNLRATLRVHFRQSVVLTKQLLARVEAVVNNWLQSLASIKTRIDLNIATRQLMKDLRDIDPVLANVETHIATETGEITIIVDLTPGSHEHVGN
jgi:hypothetical protein